MKSLKISSVLAVFIILFSSIQLSAQTADKATDTIRVNGNCGSCKKRIEAAALKTKGVEKATWNETTQLLVVTYKTDKTSAKQIGDAIAAAGHDNALATSPDGAYTKLPACCKYTRAEK